MLLPSLIWTGFGRQYQKKGSKARTLCLIVRSIALPAANTSKLETRLASADKQPKATSLLRAASVNEEGTRALSDAASLVYSFRSKKRVFATSAHAKIVYVHCKVSIKFAMTKEAETNTPDVNVAPCNSPNGPPGFLDALTAFLNKEYQDNVKKENLVISAGSTSGFLYLLTQIFPSHDTTTVYCENLTYFWAMGLLRELGFAIQGVRIESDGIDLIDLEAKWAAAYSEESRAQAKAENRYLGVLYLIPFSQNPTGVTLSVEKCEKVIKLARQYCILIFADDVYNLFHYDGHVPRRLFSYDNPNDKDYGMGHVVSNCTFSKLLSYDHQLGWAELPLALKKKYWKHDEKVNPHVALIVTELLCNNQAARRAAEIRCENKEKIEKLLSIFDKRLHSECYVIHRPTGGNFVYICLPLRLDSGMLAKLLREEHHVMARDGKEFWAGTSDRMTSEANGVRVAIAYPGVSNDLDKVLQAGENFCDVVNKFLS